MTNRIALVEAGPLVGTIRPALLAAGIEMDHFRDLASASAALRLTHYSALVIDQGLPDGAGLALLRRLRHGGQATPCMMLTAPDAIRDRIESLDAGADDCLAKPFLMAELVARVRALLRRPAIVMQSRPTCGDVEIRPDERCMVRGDTTVALSATELQVMVCLARADGTPVRRGTLENAAWGLTEAVTPNALDVVMYRLRAKLAALGTTQRIASVRSIGYVLRAARQV
ncbi:MAG: response regulator transcription factor [Rhodocyclaceae bacterium]